MYGGQRWPDYQYFNEIDPKYIRCCVHVRKGTLLATPFMILFSMGCIAVAALALVFPNSYRYLDNEHVNREFERHKDIYHIVWLLAIGLLLVGSTVHVCTLILCFCGVKLMRPRYLLAELTVMGLFVGLVIFSTIALAVLMFLVVGFLWKVSLVILGLILITSYYTYVLVWCYCYLRDKTTALREALALSTATKSVRFRSVAK